MTEWLSLPVIIVAGLALVAAIAKAGMWISEVNTDRTHVKFLLEEIRQDSKNIRARLPPLPVVKRSSPLSLTDFGEKIEARLSAGKWASRLAPSLEDENSASEPFEIDDYCWNYVREQLSPDWETKVRACAYEFGVEDRDVRLVLRVALRDARLRVLSGRTGAADEAAGMRCSKSSSQPCFGEFAKAVVESRQDLKHDFQRQHWMSTFENHCWSLYPMRIDEIRRRDIIAVFEARADGGEIFWQAKPAAAKLALQRLGYVFAVAMGREIIAENPADPAPIRAALPRRKASVAARHHKAIPHGQLGEFLARLDRSKTAHAATLFLALTTTRRTEVLGADWTEVEMKARLWTIPARRRKTNRSHVVPLSEAAIGVLDEARARTHGQGRVFPVSRTMIQRLFSNSGGTAHGLRSSFRTWCQDAGKSREIAELCLGHRIGSSVEQAYARSKLLEQRRVLLSEWAKHLGL